MTAVRKAPMRRCVGCGERKEKKELIRVVRTPEGEIRLDPTGRANGRGAYLCRDPKCLARASKSHALDRSLGARVPEEILGRLGEEMEEIVR